MPDRPDSPRSPRALPFPPPTFPSGDYAIQEVLGTGGMAVVYRARDLRRNRAVAIKVLRGDLAHVTGSGRFRREIAIASAFAHPHIVPLLDFGDAVDALGRLVPFYVMPLVEGETLRDRIARERQLPVSEAIRLIGEVLGALDYAHRQGIVHRDIKPANVLLAGGRALVADFGVSRPLPGSAHADPAGESLTQVGLTVGTPAYMSPEQMLGDASMDARADLYAAGCLLFEMLTGGPPFPGTDASAILTAKLSGQVPSIRVVRSDVPPALERIVRGALAPRPADRYASADAMLQDLAAFDRATFVPSSVAGRGPTDATPEPPGRFSAPTWAFEPTTSGSTARRGASWGAIALFAAALGLVAFGAERAWRGPAAAPPSSAVRDGVRARLAVLPFERPADDTALGRVADAVGADLVDELSHYPALRVISQAGSQRFSDPALPLDSVARGLAVGHLVTGRLARAGDGVELTVRLIDGATAAQVATARIDGGALELFRVRRAVIDSVTSFLRRAVGDQVVERDRDETQDAEAWELLARVRALHDGPLKEVTAMAPEAWRARYEEADSLAMRAAARDRAWSAPWTWSGRLLMQRATLTEVTRVAGDGVPDATALRQLAVSRLNEALTRNRDDAYARYLRGRALFELWRTARPAPDSLRLAAESDLRLATTQRADLADAWADLAMLLQATGNYEDSRLASLEALRADVFLRSAPSVLSRLMFSALFTERYDEAARWCAEGRERFGTDPRFWMCELTLLGWTARTRPDIDRAWRELALAEERDKLGMLRSGWGLRRLLVAAVVARAGLADSARAIVARVREAPATEAPPAQVDFGEAHVETLLGNRDRALTLLERYVAENPALRGEVRGIPWFAPLRGNPRFDELTAAR